MLPRVLLVAFLKKCMLMIFFAAILSLYKVSTDLIFFRMDLMVLIRWQRLLGLFSALLILMVMVASKMAMLFLMRMAILMRVMIMQYLIKQYIDQ